MYGPSFAHAEHRRIRRLRHRVVGKTDLEYDQKRQQEKYRKPEKRHRDRETREQTMFFDGHDRVSS